MFVENKTINDVNAPSVNNFFIVSIIQYEIRKKFQFLDFQLSS
jgi:hypothetical protein